MHSGLRLSLFDERLHVFHLLGNLQTLGSDLRELIEAQELKTQ